MRWHGQNGFAFLNPYGLPYSLQVEVMTPHQSHYHPGRLDDKGGNSSNPHDRWAELQAAINQLQTGG
jgi:hypothetical protein